MSDEFCFRVRDVVVAGAGLLCVSPLLGAIAVAIRLDSPGPVIFRQKRVGKDLRPFDILKFRTMTHRDTSLEDYVRDGGLAGEHDPRITRVGRVLRRTSLDELPQLVNVIRGDMSLVGPRPVVPEQLMATPREYIGRFSVPPGLTGLAQVTGRLSLNWLERLELDRQYAEGRSFWNDVKLCFQTARVVVQRTGVYGAETDNWRNYILSDPDEQILARWS